MQSITISSKNQVVIPSSVRAKLKVKSGDRLLVERVTATEVVLKKEPAYADLLGVIPAKTEDPVQRIRKLRDDWR